MSITMFSASSVTVLKQHALLLNYIFFVDQPTCCSEEHLLDGRLRGMIRLFKLDELVTHGKDNVTNWLLLLWPF